MLFAVLTLQGYPTILIFNVVELKERMMDIDLSKTEAQLSQSMLEDIDRRLAVEGKSMAAYGLPSPIKHISELEAHKLQFTVRQGQQVYDSLWRAKPLNEEQGRVFAEIVAAQSHMNRVCDGKFFFLQADAGCGKTTLAMLLAAYFRSQGKIVLICASTALAAQNYPKEGTTAHYLFKLPVEDEDLKEVDDEPIKCLLGTIPERLELVVEADVIIWDEFPSNERACFQAVYESNDLRNLRGKVFIALGDFKQILPVGMDMQDVLDSTIIQSPYWPVFKVCNRGEKQRCVIES
jgi:hypothetical protein